MREDQVLTPLILSHLIGTHLHATHLSLAAYPGQLIHHKVSLKHECDGRKAHVADLIAVMGDSTFQPCVYRLIHDTIRQSDEFPVHCANCEVIKVAGVRKCLIGLAFAIFVVSCGDQSVPPDNAVFDSAVLTESRLVDADNAFAFNLFKEIIKAQPDSNVVISPTSVAMSLGMAMNGAAGPTQEAIQSTLELSGYTLDSANECFKDLISHLRHLDPNVQMEIANSVWGREGVDFEEAFLRICRHYFDADTRTLDFSRPDAADIINSWIEQETYGKITDMVGDPLEPFVRFFLINAIYFNGAWRHKFNPAGTRSDWFTLPDGSKTPCMMMSRYGEKDPINACETTQFYAVDMPYGDSLFSMTVFLPKVGIPADSVVAGLNQDDWNRWTGSLHEWGGILHFPRFRVEYGVMMNNVLTALGMGIAFDAYDADFGNMCASGGDWWIYRVQHKTYINVDERGTEAAAATSTDGPGGIPPTLRVERPFLFFIREHRTNVIIFMGKIVDPGFE
jgi:serine protease inhibitor